MRRAGTLFNCVLLGVVIAGVTLPAHARAMDWVVIVHPSRVGPLVSAEITQIFLKKRRYWPDNELIVPVNRNAGSADREGFERALFRSASRSRITYWNRQYFGGVLPPIALDSNEAVLRYVASEPRAIGYIPASLLNDSVREAARIRPARSAR